MAGIGPTKGVRPSFIGVSGCLMDSAPKEIMFGQKRGGRSPYDALLKQLKAAGPGAALKFDDVRCRSSIVARSRKLNMKVTFGQQGETLWVKLDKSDQSWIEEKPDAKKNAMILQAIAAKRHTAGEMVSWLRSNGAPGIGITEVDVCLGNLSRDGKIKLGIHRQSDGAERWVTA